MRIRHADLHDFAYLPCRPESILRMEEYLDEDGSKVLSIWYTAGSLGFDAPNA